MITDWREPKHRRELFFRYYKYRVTTHDLDHGHYMKTLCRNYGFEQSAWYAFCFGMTYRTPQAYAFTETFPNIREVSDEELVAWNADNWKRCTYGTDARYNKGHFAKQAIGVKEWLGEQTFRERLHGICDTGDADKNFDALFDEIMTIYKYGRMTTWLTCQALYDLLGLYINPSNVLITNPNNDTSIASVWNGLCLFMGRTEQMVGKQYGVNGGYKVTEDDLARGREAMDAIFRIADERWGVRTDAFRQESIWCQYKRLFNENESKEYPGHASGDATSRYEFYVDAWPEIDWAPYAEALLTQPGLVKGQTYMRTYNAIFGKTGLLLNMHEMFDDMPNAHTALRIDPNVTLVRTLWTNNGGEVPHIDPENSTLYQDLEAPWYRSLNYSEYM